MHVQLKCQHIYTTTTVSTKCPRDAHKGGTSNMADLLLSAPISGVTYIYIREGISYESLVECLVYPICMQSECPAHTVLKYSFLFSFGNSSLICIFSNFIPMSPFLPRLPSLQFYSYLFLVLNTVLTCI